MRASRGLKWENKMYKLKRSIQLYENEWPRILLLSQFLLKNVVRVENDNNRGCKCQENKICQTYNAWFFGQTVPLGSAHIWITPSP